MDPRIKKAIKRAENEKRKEQEARLAEVEKKAKEHEKWIASFDKKADAWVAKKLFDKIGSAAAGGGDRVYLATDQKDEFIPSEALAKAAKKVDGLTVEQKWNEGYRDAEYEIDPHWEYYVKWSVR